jgi:hypothetical protein
MVRRSCSARTCSDVPGRRRGQRRAHAVAASCRRGSAREQRHGRNKRRSTPAASQRFLGKKRRRLTTVKITEREDKREREADGVSRDVNDDAQPGRTALARRLCGRGRRAEAGLLVWFLIGMWGSGATAREERARGLCLRESLRHVPTMEAPKSAGKTTKNARKMFSRHKKKCCIYCSR